MPPRKKAAVAEAAPKKAPKTASRRSAAPTDDRGVRATALLEFVNKKMQGRAELRRASEYTLPYHTKRLKTGLLSLDCALMGGFPGGAISQVIGPKNAGKDYIIWSMIRELQQTIGNRTYALLAMTEMRADRQQAQKAGAAVALNEDDIKLMSDARAKNGWPPFTEQELARMRYEVGHIHEAHGYAVEDLYDIILRAVESRVYHLIIINSFGSIMSGAEAEAESMRDKTYGGAAGPNTQFLHKLCALLTMQTKEGETRDTCIIGINQVRDDIKNPNKSYKASGGNALAHAKFVDLYVSSGKPLYTTLKVPGPMGVTESMDVYGKEVNWKIEKGKAGMHEGANGKYVYQFHQPRANFADPIVEVNNANFYLDYLSTAEKLNVMEPGTGNWKTLLGPDGQPIFNVNGRENAAQALYEDLVAKTNEGRPQDSFMSIIRNRCYQKLNININYDWD